MVSTLPGLSVSFDFELLCHSAASRPEVNPVETLFGAPINGSTFSPPPSSGLAAPAVDLKRRRFWPVSVAVGSPSALSCHGGKATVNGPEEQPVPVTAPITSGFRRCLCQHSRRCSSTFSARITIGANPRPFLVPSRLNTRKRTNSAGRFFMTRGKAGFQSPRLGVDHGWHP